MPGLNELLHGFSIALSLSNLGYCFLGVLMGTVVGILPGLGPSATIALLLPATYHLNPVSAVIMLSGICYGSMYGGSTTSILVNIPGEAASMITCLDGYQMARQGRAGIALSVAAIGSFVAGTFSVCGLAFIGPPLTKIALKFGPAEYFSLMAMSLTVITFLARGSMIKALMMVCLGLFLGVVGLDPVTSRGRFVFGIWSLYDGLPLPAVLMGLFGVSEVLENIATSISIREVFSVKTQSFLGTLQDWKRSVNPVARGTLLGFFMGILPGVGPVVPTIISYAVEKKISKHPEKFGTGEIEGVAAPEACNNAALGATFIPLLSLGIPSSGMTAMLLAALMVLGLHPGPLLISESPDLFWGVVASMYIGNVMLVVLNLPLIPLWVRMLKIPYSYMFTLILLLCLIGIYSLNNDPADVLIMIFFGIIGYVLRSLKYELPPLILAFVLGPLMETAFRRSLIISDGSLLIFVLRPISAVFIAAAVVLMILPLIVKRLGPALPEEE